MANASSVTNARLGQKVEKLWGCLTFFPLRGQFFQAASLAFPQFVLDSVPWEEHARPSLPLVPLRQPPPARLLDHELGVRSTAHQDSARDLIIT